jgi:prevent-host-death family protein
MRNRVSTLAVRAKLGHLLNRVELRHDEFIIERKGHPMAALIPMSKLEALERAARDYLSQSWDRLNEAGSDLTEEAADQLARQAVREVRAARRPRKAKP